MNRCSHYYTMKLTDKLFRCWYYLQLGWQVYFGMIFAFINFITLLYYFVLEHDPILKNIFPDFLLFGILSAIVVLFTATLLGYLHIKHGPRKSEYDITYQVNPYLSRKLVNSQLIVNTYLIISKLLTNMNKPEISTKDEDNYLITELEMMKNHFQLRTISNKLDLRYIGTNIQ